jgi:hypothetical protein
VINETTINTYDTADDHPHPDHEYSYLRDINIPKNVILLSMDVRPDEDDTKPDKLVGIMGPESDTHNCNIFRDYMSMK